MNIFKIAERLKDVDMDKDVMKYWNYTTDDIVEKKMYPLIPLQLFTLRKELKRQESKNDQEAIKEIAQKAKELAKQLAEKLSELSADKNFTVKIFINCF